MIDEKGIHYGVPHIDNKPRVSSEPLLFDIVEGRVSGCNSVNKFGFNGAVAADEEVVWEVGGAYTHPSTAGTLLISSTNVDGDNGTGTAARTVEVFGLDVNYDEINETITLDGQTGVATTGTYLRANRMIVRSAGSTGTNAGTLYMGSGTLSSGVPENKFGLITAGHNQSLMAVWTVPNSKIGFMVSMFGSTGVANKTTEVFLYARPEGEVFQVKRRYHLIASEVDHPFQLPEKFEAKTDIEIRASASGGGGAVSAGFDIFYEDA